MACSLGFTGSGSGDFRRSACRLMQVVNVV